ncbi:MAG TPA: hypothetical protein VE258_19625 [Ktedonobacterales bacterium]|nr:hypothetical protein [Ktedonobacterales bacterium]
MLVDATARRQHAERAGTQVDNQAIEQILAAMDAADERQIDLATYQHRMIRLRVATTAVILVGYIGVLAYAATKLWGAWHTGVWPPFWDTMRFAWGAFGLVSIGTAHFPHERLTLFGE